VVADIISTIQTSPDYDRFLEGQNGKLSKVGLAGPSGKALDPKSRISSESEQEFRLISTGRPWPDPDISCGFVLPNGVVVHSNFPGPATLRFVRSSIGRNYEMLSKHITLHFGPNANGVDYDRQLTKIDPSLLGAIHVEDSGRSFRCYFVRDSAPIPDEYRAKLSGIEDEVNYALAKSLTNAPLHASRLSQVYDLKVTFLEHYGIPLAQLSCIAFHRLGQRLDDAVWVSTLQLHDRAPIGVEWLTQRGDRLYFSLLDGKSLRIIDVEGPDKVTFRQIVRRVIDNDGFYNYGFVHPEQPLNLSDRVDSIQCHPGKPIQVVLSPGIRVHLANGTDEGFNVDDQTTVADIARHFGHPSAETPKVFLDGVALKDGRVLEVNPDRRPVYLKLCVFITFHQGPSRHEVEFAKGEEKASVAISRLADRLRVPESAISILQSPQGKALESDEPLNSAKIYGVKLKDQRRVFVFRLKPNPSRTP
jgi:hypothetical protein